MTNASMGTRTDRGRSLEYRVPLAITGLLVVLLSITVAIAYHEVRESAIVAGEERLQRMSAQLRSMFDPAVNTYLLAVDSVARSDPVVAYLASGGVEAGPELVAALEGLVVEVGLAAEIRNAKREVLFTVPADVSASADVPADFAAGGGLSTWNQTGERRLYMVGQPVRSESGSTIGYVTALRPFPDREGVSRVERLLSRNASLYLTSPSGSWVALDGTLRSGSIELPGEGALRYTVPGGDEVLAHAVAVAGTPWLLVIEQPLRTLLAGPGDFLRRMGIFLISIVLIGAIAAWILSRRITRPIRELVRAARAIAGGDYSRRVEVHRANELGMLASSFNAMATEIATAQAGLEEKVRQAESLASALEKANERLQGLMAESEIAQQEAEKASRAKSEFLATISHELRTPINAIVGYTDLMLLGIPGPVTPGQIEHLERIRRNGRHLTRLVDDILDLAKIEAGLLHIQGVVSVAEEAAEAALAIVHPLATEKGIEVIVEWGKDSETLYHADARRVEQILVNLLGNAVKFTPSGGSIRVRCRKSTGPAEDGGVGGDERVIVDVEDTGIGVPPDKLEVIFERFVQGESGYRRSHEGAGLGLAISRELARHMGGDILVRSRPGEGSVFSLVLPATQPADSAAPIRRARREGELGSFSARPLAS